MASKNLPTIEWPTLLLIAAATGGAIAALWLPIWLATPTLVICIALQASLQHEVIHGHPLPRRAWSEALVMASLNLAIPYGRFRDTHLAHHHDERLTDPYDDPESNYLDPAQWQRRPAWIRAVLLANNTLAGRMLLGPLISQLAFMRGDWALIRAGAPHVGRDWAVHVACAAVILALVWAAPLPIWAYLLACYGALSVLKIRTFLEHQAHMRARGRTVVIEDRGPLAFLFLNNNLHVVHHMHPKVPWYELPALYAANRDTYLRRNLGYRFSSYAEIFTRYLWRAKDPVAHPLWPQGDGGPIRAHEPLDIRNTLGGLGASPALHAAKAAEDGGAEHGGSNLGAVHLGQPGGSLGDLGLRAGDGHGTAQHSSGILAAGNSGGPGADRGHRSGGGPVQ